MTPKNNRELNALLSQTGLTELKTDLVRQFTDGRTESRALMNDQEADNMIKFLRSKVVISKPGEKMRKKIISLAHEMHWHDENQKIDMKRVNGWCVTYGMFKKRLNDHSELELTALVTQFETVYKKFIAGL